GPTNVSGGTLSLGAAGNLSNNSINFSGNAALQSTGAAIDLGAGRSIALGTGGGTIDVTAANGLTVSGVVSGGAGNLLTKVGTGTLTLSNGSNTYAGGTSINQRLL